MVLLYILEMSTLINISHPADPIPKLAGNNDDEPLPTDGPDDIHGLISSGLLGLFNWVSGFHHLFVVPGLTMV